MPQKPKLHNGTGKLKIISKPASNSSIPSTSSENTDSTNSDEKFQLELYWCIQQVQAALESNKLNPKQAQEHTKTLNILTSKNTSVVKKRQTMRLSFGDYRQKMIDEEKKLNRVNGQFILRTESPSKKSVFVKKSAFLKSDSDFKFDFKIPEEEINSLSINDKEESTAPTVYHFKPSSNEFRFNFESDCA